MRATGVELIELWQAFMPLVLVFIVVGIRRTEDGLLNRLRQAGAEAPRTAAPLPRVSRFAKGRLRRLLGDGAVREAEPGLYYVVEADVAAYRARRRRLTLIVIAVALAFAAAMVLLSRLL